MLGEKETSLTPEQSQRAEAIYQSLKSKMDSRLREMAELLASKEPEQLLGKTEFELRDLAHQLAADAQQTAAQEQSKKGAT